MPVRVAQELLIAMVQLPNHSAPALVLLLGVGQDSNAADQVLLTLPKHAQLIPPHATNVLSQFVVFITQVQISTATTTTDYVM